MSGQKNGRAKIGEISPQVFLLRRVYQLGIPEIMPTLSRARVPERAMADMCTCNRTHVLFLSREDPTPGQWKVPTEDVRVLG